VNNRIAWVGLGALLSAFAAALLWMVNLRLDRGEGFPPYSSSRADPLGTRVLYETLERLPGVPAARNYRSLDRFKAPEDSVLFVIHLDNTFQTTRELHEIAGAGTHVIVALDGVGRWNPQQKTAPEERSQERHDDEPPTEEAGDPSEPDPAAEKPEPEVKSKLSGQTVPFQPLHPPLVPLHRILTPELCGDGPDGPLPWYGNRAFEMSASPNHWEILHRIEGKPVAMTRECGRGRVTVFSDSYLFSNEAMSRHPAVPLLVKLIGGRKQVVFDESVHGQVENPGVASLVHKHGFAGFFWMLLLVGLLAFWRHAGPPETFLRTRIDEKPLDAPQSTLHSLLLRHIPTGALVRTALELHRKDVERRGSVETRRRAQAAVLDTSLDPVRSYNLLRNTLKHGGHSHHKR